MRGTHAGSSPNIANGTSTTLAADLPNRPFTGTTSTGAVIQSAIRCDYHHKVADLGRPSAPDGSSRPARPHPRLSPNELAMTLGRPLHDLAAVRDRHQGAPPVGLIGTRRTKPWSSSRSTMLVTLVGWIISRSPILPMGRAPPAAETEQDQGLVASKRQLVRRKTSSTRARQSAGRHDEVAAAITAPPSQRRSMAAGFGKSDQRQHNYRILGRPTIYGM